MTQREDQWTNFLIDCVLHGRYESDLRWDGEPWWSFQEWGDDVLRDADVLS